MALGVLKDSALVSILGYVELLKASQIAILNANYMAKELENDYKILYRGTTGLNAHEFIIDCREFKNTSGITNEDIAKRLIDYGYHAPTMSWPVANSLMIEPTESESKDELDRLSDASMKMNLMKLQKVKKNGKQICYGCHYLDICDDWEPTLEMIRQYSQKNGLKKINFGHMYQELIMHMGIEIFSVSVQI